MREHTRRLLPVAVAVVVASVCVAAPASAGSHEVAVGGSDSGSDHPVTATSIASPQWVYETQSGSSLSTGCSSTRLDLTVRSGAGSGAFAVVPGGSSTGCSGPLSVISHVHVGTWQLDLTGPATAGGADVVDGVLRHVRIDQANAACRFSVVGEARVRFHEATQRLEVVETGRSGRLRQSGVVGCLGQIREGGAVDWKVTFDLASPDGAVTVR